MPLNGFAVLALLAAGGLVVATPMVVSYGGELRNGWASYALHRKEKGSRVILLIKTDKVSGGTVALPLPKDITDESLRKADEAFPKRFDRSLGLGGILSLVAYAIGLLLVGVNVCAERKQASAVGQATNPAGGAGGLSGRDECG